jgi:hypothetical protein
VQAVLKGSKVLLSHEASKYRLMLELPGDECELHRGRTEGAVVRGITGLGFMRLEPIYTIECAIPFDQDVKWQLMLAEED